LPYHAHVALWTTSKQACWQNQQRRLHAQVDCRIPALPCFSGNDGEVLKSAGDHETRVLKIRALSQGTWNVDRFTDNAGRRPASPVERRAPNQ
jgi:hypothetical protein